MTTKYFSLGKNHWSKSHLFGNDDLLDVGESCLSSAVHAAAAVASRAVSSQGGALAQIGPRPTQVGAQVALSHKFEQETHGLAKGTNSLHERTHTFIEG